MSNSLAPRNDRSPNPGDRAETAAFQEPSVVHSGSGRLRVHLPHWSGARAGDVAAEVARLPGVTAAEANPLTGNVLILFDPGQTSAPTLLAALPALEPANPPLLQLVCSDPARPEEPGEAVTVPLPSAEAQQPGSIVYMTGTGRVVYKALGWTSVGLAVVGAITPGIPTAPFVILAGYFFTRSSSAAHEWLRQSRWFGPVLRDWEDHRGVRRWMRNAALGLIGAGMVVTAFLGLSLPVTATIISCQIVGIGIVLSLPVIEPAEPAPAS